MFKISQSNTRVGVATFSDKYETAIHLNDFTNKTDLMEEIGGVPYLGGNTNTGGAIEHVRREFEEVARREVYIFVFFKI